MPYYLRKKRQRPKFTDSKSKIHFTENRDHYYTYNFPDDDGEEYDDADFESIQDIDEDYSNLQETSQDYILDDGEPKQTKLKPV